MDLLEKQIIIFKWYVWFFKGKEKSGEDIEVKDAYVLKKDAIIDKDKNCYVSDHFPVYVEFFHKNKKWKNIWFILIKKNINFNHAY